MSAPSNSDFRVIIVGGGPIGMVVAHALTAAGIDHVLLESHHSFETDNPTLTALWPHTVRLFDQLGLLDEMERQKTHFRSKIAYSAEGKRLWEMPALKAMEEWHGIAPICLLRHRFIKILAHDLIDRPNVHLSKRVETIRTRSAGRIEVVCKDGSIEEGSIIIGADGPWSIVRKTITAARRAESLPSDPDMPFTVQWKGIFCQSQHSELTRNIPRGSMMENRGTDFHFQGLAEEDVVNFCVMRKVPHGPATERKRWTQDEMDEMLRECEDVNIFNDGLKVRDLLVTKTYSWMTNVEEGQVRHWHHERLVLVGDSTHKMSPQAAFGINMGMQHVTELVNRLHALLAKSGRPDDASLSALFQGYQEDMRKHEDLFCNISSMVPRQISGMVFGFNFVDRFICPYIDGDKYAFKLMAAKSIGEGRVFHFLKENKQHKIGSFPWKNVSPLNDVKKDNEDQI